MMRDRACMRKEMIHSPGGAGGKMSGRVLLHRIDTPMERPRRWGGGDRSTPIVCSTGRNVNIAAPVEEQHVMHRQQGLDARFETLDRRERQHRMPGEPEPLLAYELVQGHMVRYCRHPVEGGCEKPPPTAVLLHGIMGSKRNMQSFAKKLVEGFPNWQVLLVDLRCHGDSAVVTEELKNQQHTVAAAAADVLKLLSALKLFPEVLIGHSFGGKVVMSMAHQFGQGVKRLPRPVHVWVLDATPGEVRAGENLGSQDRPKDLIRALRNFPLPVQSRRDLTVSLEQQGFSSGVAAWAATNLVPAGDGAGLVWKVDLGGIEAMYRSYEETNMWPLLMSHADGIKVSFVRAEQSTFRWSGMDQNMIEQYGHHVHLLRNSGHWVHTDNPNGLFHILAPTFGTMDMRMQHSPGVSRKSSMEESGYVIPDGTMASIDWDT